MLGGGAHTLLPPAWPEGRTGAFAFWGHSPFSPSIPWGSRGGRLWAEPWSWKGGLWVEKEVSAAWTPGEACGGWAAPCPLLSLAHLSHCQSSRSLMDTKLEGDSGLQSAWRAQQLSYQMTTGDSERAA